MRSQPRREIDGAHDLFDLLLAETGAGVRVERFAGHMGMFNLNHVLVHLRNNLVRQRGGLRTETVRISADAAFLDDIPAELSALYEVVPQAAVRELRPAFRAAAAALGADPAPDVAYAGQVQGSTAEERAEGYRR